MKAIFYTEVACPECGKVLNMVQIKKVWYVSCRTDKCVSNMKLYVLPTIELREVIR